MKDEEKQIEEMQKIMEYCCNVYDDKGRHIRNKCNTFDCEYYCDTNNVCCSFSKKEATALYDAGYRKLLEDSVVLSKEEFELYDVVKKGYPNDISCLAEKFTEIDHNARKETAEKLLNDLWYSKLETTITIQHHSSKEDMENVGKAIIITIRNKIQELAKQFGVEIKE